APFVRHSGTMYVPHERMLRCRVSIPGSTSTPRAKQKPISVPSDSATKHGSPTAAPSMAKTVKAVALFSVGGKSPPAAYTSFKYDITSCHNCSPSPLPFIRTRMLRNFLQRYHRLHK